ncbi:MAG: GNAT family N-acetyltransferase [Eubacteriales bacterium]|nr:GNAT family N-acetyltransferase [Eubacteriales bacterium]
MAFTALSGVENREIMECVNLAFSDYPMPIHFTEDSLQGFFEASDVDKELSFAAYAGGTMVGFILNSANLYQGEPVAFDAGTGVIPAFRGQGVFSGLYAFAEQALRRRGIRKYYLEVLQQNERAKEIL